MKRIFVLFILFLCGCSNKVILKCNYVDNSSILGSKSVNDVIVFKNDKIISFNRSIVFNSNSNIDTDLKTVYKVIKTEGKALKKYIGGKYRIRHSSDSVNMIFRSKKFNNLKYIGLDSEYGYDEVIGIYSELGFVCE